MLEKFKRNISLLGRSPKTFENYSRHVAAIALHYNCLPTLLDAEQVKDYLYLLQQRSKTPSQTYFKHTVYGLRFILKTEGFAYDHLHLPSIAKSTKLPVVLSKQEVWQMLKVPILLKHKVLIALLYGCGLRCSEVSKLELRHIDFDRETIHIVQSKGNKDRILPMGVSLKRVLQKYVLAEKPEQYLFTGQMNETNTGEKMYSSRGIQWAVKTIAKQAGISKVVHTHTMRHTYACHCLENGMNIVTLKDLLGHKNIETTMEYLKICQLDDKRVFSPLDNLFAQCGRSTK